MIMTVIVIVILGGSLSKHLIPYLNSHKCNIILVETI